MYLLTKRLPNSGLCTLLLYARITLSSPLPYLWAWFYILD